MTLSTKTVRSLDFWLIIGMALLLSLGLLVLSSASANVGQEPFEYFKKQSLWVFLGIVALVVSLFFHYKTFSRFANWIYGFNLIMLISVFFVGSSAKGAQRWIDLGFFQFQPSELSKLLLILTFADFLYRRHGRLNTLWELIPCFLYVGVPMLLILKQPDLGTSLVFVVITFGMMLVAGANRVLLVTLLLSGLAVAVSAIYLHLEHGMWIPLKDYQVNRLIIFLNPELDPLRSGYQIRQSLVAIGTGGFWGMGLFRGTQSQLNFLPDHHTDFIFSVIAEELGFFGVIVFLSLFCFIFIRSLKVALNARDLYGTLLVTGVVSMYLFHVAVNIGMAASIMPVTGLPLPFVSYGGTAMLVNLLSFGMIVNVKMRSNSMLF